MDQKSIRIKSILIKKTIHVGAKWLKKKILSGDKRSDLN